MNKLDYASLEASKRLVEAGIVLETDFKWHQQTDGSFKLVESAWPTWELAYPAPSMAEVWRELPEKIGDRRKTIVAVEGLTLCGYTIQPGYFTSGQSFTKGNPTDALIDLLIWARQEATDD